MLFGVYLLIRKRAVLRYIYRLLAVYVPSKEGRIFVPSKAGSSIFIC